MKHNKITSELIKFLEETETMLRMDKKWFKKMAIAVTSLQPIINWNLY